MGLHLRNHPDGDMDSGVFAEPTVAGQVARSAFFSSPPIDEEVTLDLAATETGSDTAAIELDTSINLDLAATETGSDTAAIELDTEVPPALIELSAVESGSDTAQVELVAVNSLTISAEESSSDISAILFEAILDVNLSAIEVGDDVANLQLATTNSLTLAVQESGSDFSLITISELRVLYLILGGPFISPTLQMGLRPPTQLGDHSRSTPDLDQVRNRPQLVPGIRLIKVIDNDRARPDIVGNLTRNTSDEEKTMEAQDIIGYYKGEPVSFYLLAKAPEGDTPLPTPTLQTIILTIASSEGGSPLLTFNNRHTLIDEPTARFLVTVSAADLATLKEGKKYFYNVWSKLNSADPHLQARGQLILQPSIEVVP